MRQISLGLSSSLLLYMQQTLGPSGKRDVYFKLVRLSDKSLLLYTWISHYHCVASGKENSTWFQYILLSLLGEYLMKMEIYGAQIWLIASYYKWPNVIASDYPEWDTSIHARFNIASIKGYININPNFKDDLFSSSKSLIRWQVKAH